MQHEKYIFGLVNFVNKDDDVNDDDDHHHHHALICCRKVINAEAVNIKLSAKLEFVRDVCVVRLLLLYAVATYNVTTDQIDVKSTESQTTDAVVKFASSSSTPEALTVNEHAQTTSRQLTDGGSDEEAPLSGTELVVVVTAACIVVFLLTLLVVGVAVRCVRRG